MSPPFSDWSNNFLKIKHISSLYLVVTKYSSIYRGYGIREVSNYWRTHLSFNFSSERRTWKQYQARLRFKALSLVVKPFSRARIRILRQRRFSYLWVTAYRPQAVAPLKEPGLPGYKPAKNMNRKTLWIILRSYQIRSYVEILINITKKYLILFLFS